MKNSKKRKNKKKNDSFIYIIFLSVITILLTAINNFSIINVKIDIFILPIIILLYNYFFEEFGFKETFNTIIIGTLTIIMYLFLLYTLENRIINIVEVLKDCSIYFIILYINLIFNQKIDKKSTSITTINYLLICIIYLVLYIVFKKM